ncbi:uncharacterized protein F5Z01DRAFT_665198 [Emericellopsis atlantica]|uniref:Chitin deacetylase n=1 Tax=Emericellopsis atlantica TaxID=2614577 RepID=A0A9P7ZEY5_9HYPO|nr:uncharacterized protein F5Z01DRAFT_665198 [Emericellopsis atlantica]KAG9250750.1 hypothetical protein F5Z01DRAFT_665198 [Emericellopsis atlantica]
MRYSMIIVAASLASSVLGSPRLLAKRTTCGQGLGGCAPGECCSEGGYCGTATDYCKSPACQIPYSDGNCDADEKPCGASTEDYPRTKAGSAPYDTIIKSCTEPNVVALTFDDGPYLYTSSLLDTLREQNVKATFFINGNNNGKGRIDDPANPWAAIIQRTYAEGHQIASHTWTHEDLSLADSDRRTKEIVYNEMALRNILGFFPTYMRPPRGSCTRASGSLDRLTELGYHIVNWDLDTKDYLNDSPDAIQKSKDLFDEGFNGTASPIVLSHDTHEQTVVTLVEYMISAVKAKGFNLVTVGECLGDDEANWYTQAPASSECSIPGGNPETTPGDDGNNDGDLAPSKDGTCGERSQGKYTCKGSDYGDCCSYNGFCGGTSGYCDGGCQTDFGSCNKYECGDDLIVSENGLCGSDTFQTCLGSVYGNCCSKHGNCGETEAYCASDDGCQVEWGQCS